MEITGIIETGEGKAAFFTSLDWVVTQFEREMGFKPFPGTLNVRVSDREISRLMDFLAHIDFELIPTDPDFCAARMKRVWVNGVIPAAVVIPSEDVRIHSDAIIEIMSDRHIRDALDLEPGDEVMITDIANA